MMQQTKKSNIPQGNRGMKEKENLAKRAIKHWSINKQNLKKRK
jgi:hypothetical protein